MLYWFKLKLKLNLFDQQYLTICIILVAMLVTTITSLYDLTI